MHRSRIMHIQHLLISLLAAGLCGCAITPKRPPQIPAFAAADEKFGSCPKIMGRYSDSGQAFTNQGISAGQMSLSKLLFGSDLACVEADSVNVVEPEPEMIDFQFCKDGQPVATRRVSKYTWNRATGGYGVFENWDSSKYGQPYYSVKGFMDIPIKESHGGAAGVGMYVSGTDCLLRKGIDGSLVVVQKDSGFGVVVIVPFWSSHCTWYRFPPIADGDQLQHNLVK